jgi:hypothetical protein
MIGTAELYFCINNELFIKLVAWYITLTNMHGIFVNALFFIHVILMPAFLLLFFYKKKADKKDVVGLQEQASLHF